METTHVGEMKVSHPQMFRDFPVGALVTIPWGRRTLPIVVRKENGWQGIRMAYHFRRGMVMFLPTGTLINVGGYRTCWAKFRRYTNAKDR